MSWYISIAGSDKEALKAAIDVHINCPEEVRSRLRYCVDAAKIHAPRAGAPKRVILVQSQGHYDTPRQMFNAHPETGEAWALFREESKVTLVEFCGD